eukprot:g16339.t1
MWANSASESVQEIDHGDDQLLREVKEALPELQGEGADGDSAMGLEARREDPFPTSSERGALEAASASQQALLAGKRGLMIDVEVRQLDDGHAEFDQDMLIDFVTVVSKALATVSGRTKVLLRGVHLAERATEMLEKANTEGEEVGIEPRRDISFCSFQMSNTDEEDDEDSMSKFTSTLGLGDERERVFVMACPRRLADVTVLREVILVANGRPVVVLNPRVPYMPFEMEAFEIVYQLRQYNVQPAKANPKAAKRRMRGPRLTRLSQSQQNIFSELGQPIPRVLATRAFPDDFKLYVDVDGKGFQLESAYETKPQPAVLAFTAQKRIREFQDQVANEEKKANAQNRGFQIDDDDDFDWDTINDDLAEGEEPFIEPPMPSEEEINSRLRDG